MIYDWYCIFTPGMAGGEGRKGTDAVRMRNEQLQESRDDGMKGEAGASIREQN